MGDNLPKGIKELGEDVYSMYEVEPDADGFDVDDAILHGADDDLVRDLIDNASEVAKSIDVGNLEFEDYLLAACDAADSRLQVADVDDNEGDW